MIVTLKDVQQAREKISQAIKRTQLDFSHSCSKWIGTSVYLKLENEQTTGSFKIRGAMNKMLSLSDEERDRGIIAASAGNHAQGVAYSATHAGAQSHIVMPLRTPLVKAMATQSYGAKVILHGSVYDESEAHARELMKQKGYTFIHPFEDKMVIAGQGTVGLEILEELADVDSIVVAIGGGGLISGVATVIKALRPKCKIYGAMPKAFHGMEALLHGGQLPVVPALATTIADGTAVKHPSKTMYDSFISKYVEDIAVVEEDEIAQAIVFLLERAKTVAEGSGALTLAAAAKMAGKWDLGKKCCVIVSGGNIDLNLVSIVIEKGLSRSGRIARLSVIVGDQPGVLHELTKAIAEQRANILQVVHDRLRPYLAIKETAIEFLLETRSDEHVEEIRKALERVGAKIVNP